MQDHSIAGAVVSAVSTDGTLLVKGYGYADVESGRKVDPHNDLFRVASISKLFTATAIMQLVEQGRIDLDTDIRAYLGDLGYDDSKGAITVADLLTHTAGFEDRIFGYFGANPDLENKPRSEQFAALAPKQVRAPGEWTAYSNYGFALLGEIVARVSGLSYAEYIERRIFVPLRMESSATSIRSTASGTGDAKTERLRVREAKSHRPGDGWLVTQSFPETLDLLEPEGSIATTAADMTRFMRAHLNDGALDGAPILSVDTTRKMHETLYSDLPGIVGNAHGFWVNDVAGYRTLEHGGSINDFKSNLVLIPELGLGVFVSTNSAAGSALSRLPERLVREFFLRSPDYRTSTGGNTSFDPNDLAGRYLGARRVHSRLGKLLSAPDILTVAVADDDALVVSGDFGAVRYERMPDGVYRSLKSLEPIGFEPADGDKPALIHFGGSAHNAYERLTVANDPATFFGPVALASVACLAVFAGYLVRLFGYRIAHASVAPLAERSVVLAGAAATLAYIGFAALTLANLVANPNILYDSFPTPSFRIAFVLGWLAVAASAIVGLVAVRALFGDERNVFQKARLLLFAAVLIDFSWSVFHWKALAF